MKRILSLCLIIALFGCVETQHYKGGDSYVGEWENGKRHGQGTYTWASGGTYVGQWKKGDMHGTGKRIYQNGDVYEGSFEYDKRYGYGVMKHTSGSSYAGYWKDNKKEGQGTFKYANGAVYVGPWKDDKRNGLGKLTYTSGDEYVGEFKDDKAHGQGYRTYAGGDRYTGGYKDGNWHGKADFRYVDGSSFSCFYKDGRPLDPGIYKTSAGRQYFGLAQTFVAVTSIVPNSQAARIGLQRGDIFLEYNGTQIRDVAQAKQLVKDAKPSAAATLKILRANKIQTFNLNSGTIGVWFQDFPRLVGRSATSCAVKSNDTNIWVLIDSKCKGDWANGHGTAVTLDMTRSFEGQFKDGLFVEGKYTSGAHTYEGAWRNHKLHGHIVQKINGKIAFKGNYVNGRPHGDATCSDSGNLEPCTFDNGKRTDELYVVRERQQRLAQELERERNQAERERERERERAEEERKRIARERKAAEREREHERLRLKAERDAEANAQMWRNLSNALDKTKQDFERQNQAMQRQNEEINKQAYRQYNSQPRYGEKLYQQDLERIQKDRDRRTQEIQAQQEADRQRKEQMLAELQKQQRDMEQKLRHQQFQAQQNRQQPEENRLAKLSGGPQPSRANSSYAKNPAAESPGPTMITRQIGAPDVSQGGFTLGESSFTSIRNIRLKTCNFSEITAGLKFTTLMGEVVEKYGVRMTPAPGADASSIRNLKVGIALTGSGHTGYVYHTSVNLDKSGGSFSFDVSGSPSWDKFVQDSSGRFYDRDTVMDILKKTDRICLVFVEEVPY